MNKNLTPVIGELTKAKPEIDYEKIFKVIKLSELKKGDLIVFYSEFAPPIGTWEFEERLHESLEQMEMDFKVPVLSLPPNYDIKLIDEVTLNEMGYIRKEKTERKIN